MRSKIYFPKLLRTFLSSSPTVVFSFCLLNSSPLAIILHITTPAPFLLCRQPAISSSKSRTGSDGEDEMSRDASGGFEPPRERRRRRKRKKAEARWEAKTQKRCWHLGSHLLCLFPVVKSGCLETQDAAEDWGLLCQKAAFFCLTCFLLNWTKDYFFPVMAPD